MLDDLIDKGLFGRYELIRELGRGGMGVVYLAKDPELGRQVAIKCVEHQQGDELFAKRLRREATLMAKLNHSNIVQLYDVVECGGVLGLVIEYVDGATLLEKSKELLPDQVTKVKWLIEIAKGLEQAHSVGVVHCDLKPQNILITHQGQAKIADFGIAKVRLESEEEAAKDDLTKFGSVTGSYLSISPEQATGKEFDFRSDLFSFGVLAHLLLTGEHPFGDAGSQLEIVHRIIAGESRILPAGSADLSSELRDLICALLQNNPEHRPQQTKTLIHYLEKALDVREELSSDFEGLTVELSIPPVIAGKRTWLWWVPFFFLAMFIVVIWFINENFMDSAEKPSTSGAVIVIEPALSVVGDFDEELSERIVVSLKDSIQETILRLSTVSLLPSVQLERFDGNITRMATANAATIVLNSSLKCSSSTCQIEIQKLVKGESGKFIVESQRTWPSLASSLLDIRITTANETHKILAAYESADTKPWAISEHGYAEYIEVQSLSSNGGNANDSHLARLDTVLLESPDFISAYILYGRAALSLYSSTEQPKYLEQLTSLIASSPTKVRRSFQIKRLEFNVALEEGRLDRALDLINIAKGVTNDRVGVNDLRAAYAYATEDFDLALKIDEDNAVLMPSSTRLYNLAFSRLTFGNYSGAKKALERAILIYPEYIKAQELLATVSLLSGDIDGAIQTFRRLHKISTSDTSLASYGAALILAGDYAEAAVQNRKALDINDRNLMSMLNLADSYNLLGDSLNATRSYEQALAFSRNLNKLEDYLVQVQAYAHLGRHKDSIRVLRLAQSKFPNAVDVNYVAAIAHVLAGNTSAAIVEVEASVREGTAAVWFRLPWFKVLCADSSFRLAVNGDRESVCFNLL